MKNILESWNVDIMKDAIMEKRLNCEGLDSGELLSAGRFGIWAVMDLYCFSVYCCCNGL